MNHNGDLVINLSQYGESLGPREIGKQIREEVFSNLKDGKSVFFSFRNVHLISSGFADELFGQLFIDLGEERFKNQVKLNDFNNEQEKNFVLKAIINSLEFRKKQSAGIQKMRFLSEDGEERIVYAISNKLNKFYLEGVICSKSKENGVTALNNYIFSVEDDSVDEAVNKANAVVKKKLSGKNYHKVEFFDSAFDPLYDTLRKEFQ